MEFDKLEIIAIAAFHTLQDPIKAKTLVSERLRLADQQFGKQVAS